MALQLPHVYVCVELVNRSIRSSSLTDTIRVIARRRLIIAFLLFRYLVPCSEFQKYKI
jgi:hypothetical protein